MSLPQPANVLIVGAGPVGVVTALSLLHHGVRDIVLVDSVLQGENSSRAHVIHAATMEALDKVGAASDLLARCLKVDDVRMYTRTCQLVHANFSLLNGFTDYPYSFLLPQNVTVKILTERLRGLGVGVHRPCTVVGLRQNASDPRTTDVLFEGGQVITATYVIGADGARSTVRTSAGISFTDPERDKEEPRVTQMILADFTFTREPDMRGLFNGVMSAYSWCVLFNLTDRFNGELALPGETIHGSIYRMVCGIPTTSGAPPPSPSREYVQMALNAHGPVFMSSDPKVNPDPIEVDRVVWSARFRTHCAIADRIFTRLGGDGGVILLVGDAAHIHPPAGGQGMNLGLRDAVFLAEALSKHIRALSSLDDQTNADDILHGFAKTRLDRALGTIAFTRQYLQFVSLPYSTRWWMPVSLGTIRDLFIRFCGRFRFLQFKVAWRLSGLGSV